MRPEIIGIIVGGLIPAVLFGLGNVMVKGAEESGIGTGAILIAASIGYFIAGILFLLLEKTPLISVRVTALSIAMGLAWGLGTGLVAFALARYGSSVAVLTPLYNTNALITVALGLWIFAEWKEVHVPTLLIGTILTVVGGVLVARA